MRYLVCFIIVLMLANTKEASAQYYDQALGIRGGTSVELSYKRFIFYTPSIQQAIEGLVGYHLDEWDKRYNGIVIEGLYLFHLDLGFDTGFSGFAGAGLYGGVYVETGRPAYFGGGATIAVGVSYTFTHVPVSLSIDWKPLFGFPRYPYKSLGRGAVTIRYVLPTTWQ